MSGRRYTPEEKVKAKADFLEALAQAGSIMGAALIVGFTRFTYYNWADDDPEFKAAADKITRHSGKVLVNTLYKRALDGTMNPKDMGALKAAELWMRHHGMLKDVSEVRQVGKVRIRFGPDSEEKAEGDDEGGTGTGTEDVEPGH